MSTPPAPLKLFFSYAREDEELRDELKTHLKPLMDEGVIDVWDDGGITGGQEWDKKIKGRLSEADIILLLISPDFLASDYIHTVEVTQAMERHEAGTARVIPVILRECEWRLTPLARLQALPKNAQPIKPRRNRDKAFNEVARGIHRAAQELLATRKPPPTTAAPPPKASTSSIIPRPPAVGFVSRRDEQGRDIVERLRDELSPEHGRLVALWGPGGSGKTTLAAEVARDLRPVFGDRLAWVSALGRADFSLSTLLDEIATQLGRPDLRTLALAPKAEQVRALVSASPALVVLDNFETIKPEEQTPCAAFLAGCGECPALITTRAIIQREDVVNVRLAAMEPDEAREFLRRLIEQASKPSAFAGLDRDELIRECEANPLVMQWVVSQLVLARRPQDVLDEIRRGSGDAAERVFARSFNLPQLGDDGRSALLALSLFAPDASREALANVAGFGDDLQRLDRAVANLSSLWLIETTDGNARLLLRGLTRQMAKSRLAKAPHANEFSQRFVAYFLAYAEAHMQKTAEDFDALEAEKGNILSAQSVAFEGQDWPRVIQIHFALGEFLDVRGYWGEAVNMSEQSLQAARSLQNESAVAGISHNLAMIYQNRGELTDTRRLYGESLEINKRLGDKSSVAKTLHQLAMLAQDAGELDEARQFYGESLEIKESLGDQSGIAKTLHQLGWLADSAGELDEARRLYGESLEINKRLGDLRSVAKTLHQLAMLAQGAGDLDEARRLYDESLEIKEGIGDLRGIAVTLGQLGTLAEEEGDVERASRLYQEALSIFERLKSPYAEMARRFLERVENESS